MLPEMSGLQFLVVQLLFAGPQRGEQLRRKMRKAGAKVGPPSFSRLMRRMEQAGYLQTQTEAGPAGCRFVWPRRFEVTDLGVAIWRRVREFYTAGGEPRAPAHPKGFAGLFAEVGRRELIVEGGRGQCFLMHSGTARSEPWHAFQCRPTSRPSGNNFHFRQGDRPRPTFGRCPVGRKLGQSPGCS
jgi:DNA-binding PadR family transcriptional regulator